MKFLDKLALKLFSCIIIVIAIVFILSVTHIISIYSILDEVESLILSGESKIEITIAIFAVLLLLALKGLFFTSKTEDTGKDGIVLENTSGKLVISKESLENLIANIIKDVPGAETVSSRTFLDKNGDLIIYVTAIVSKDVMIKDISSELQEKIKIAMKKTADLDVKEVNIKIKNISSKKVKGLPAPEETVSDEVVEKINNSENNDQGEE